MEQHQQTSACLRRRAGLLPRDLRQFDIFTSAGALITSPAGGDGRTDGDGGRPLLIPYSLCALVPLHCVLYVRPYAPAHSPLTWMISLVQGIGFKVCVCNIAAASCMSLPLHNAAQHAIDCVCVCVCVLSRIQSIPEQGELSCRRIPSSSCS